MSGQDDLKTSNIAIVGVIGAFLTFVVIVLLMVIYHRVEERVEEKTVFSQSFTELEKTLEDQRASLVQYTREGDVVRVPIDRAMDLVVADLRAGRPPVRVPPPAAASESGKDTLQSESDQSAPAEENERPEAAPEQTPDADSVDSNRPSEAETPQAAEAESAKQSPTESNADTGISNGKENDPQSQSEQDGE